MITMTNSDIVRRIDRLGRFHLPKDIRDTVGIKPGDKVCLTWTRDGTIVIERKE